MSDHPVTQVAGDDFAVELRHLRYFIAVAEELHFGRAATRLYVSQSALSQAVSRTEKQLGVKLLLRTRRNVRLTPAGAELLRDARILIADHRQAMRRVRSIGLGETTASIQLGVALLAETVVAPALAAFSDARTRLVIERTLALSERILEHLQAGMLHAAVVHQLPALASTRGIQWERLRTGRLAAVASATSPLAQRPRVSLRDLRDETFLVNPRTVAPGAFEGLTIMCRDFGSFDAHILESTAASTMTLDADRHAIQDGGAIALVAEPVARAMEPTGLAVIPLDPPPQYVIALAWRCGEQPAPVARLIEHIRNYRDRHAWAQ
jgi:DNA-binding transcriptional LysR family regulator